MLGLMACGARQNLQNEQNFSWVDAGFLALDSLAWVDDRPEAYLTLPIQHSSTAPCVNTLHRDHAMRLRPSDFLTF